MWTASTSTAPSAASPRTAKNPTPTRDFRKLLERKDVHAIINGTPDHWHSLINIGAAKAGKDIYSEKPLTLTIDEGKHVVRAVRDNKVVLQTGTQQRSSQRFRMACELVRNGRIGKLKEVTVWLPAGVRGGPFETKPVPENLELGFLARPGSERALRAGTLPHHLPQLV